MTTTALYIISCVICHVLISQLGGAIHIKIIPEYLNSYHQGGNFSWCDLPCIFSENPENPDGEFYIAMNNDDVKKAIAMKSGAEIKILGSQEPPHYYNLLKFNYLRQYFQGTALLNRESDIPWPLIMNLDNLKKSPMPGNAEPKATFVARNCLPMNNRNHFVREIANVVGIIAPSKCFHNLEWPQCEDSACSKVEVLRRYKIYLAFENGDSPGFITDKIYHAYEAGVLPVWMGTRDIEDVVPKHSYIDVADFDTPLDVAIYLKKVLENETLYNSYFEWKWKPFDPEFDLKNRLLWEETIHCRLCRYVDTLQRGMEWNHLLQRGTSNKQNPGSGSGLYIRYEPGDTKNGFLFLPLICFLFILVGIFIIRRKIAKFFSFLLYRPAVNSN